jgi:hypothetical protein
MPQGGNIGVGCKPDGRYIDPEIVVDEFIPHAGDILPWDFRIRIAHSPGDPLGGFSNDFDLTDNPILKK